MSNRAIGLPTEPTFVFSSFYHNDGRTGVLRDLKVDAVMESFWSIRKEKYPRRVFRAVDWPARRYLDSGIFTLMSKAGVHRIKSRTEDATLNFRKIADDLLNGYLSYLSIYADEWDHIVEVDTDMIPGLGPEYTLRAREQLIQIVGYDKLLPVWHSASEFASRGSLDAWHEMIGSFPYVAIGGDAKRDTRLYRKMVSSASKAGTIVHALGNTNPAEFKSIGWLTGDSTNWIYSLRYATFTDIVISNRKKTSTADLSKTRQVLDKLAQYDITLDDLLAEGKTYAKMFYCVMSELERQEALRQWSRSHAG